MLYITLHIVLIDKDKFVHRLSYATAFSVLVLLLVMKFPADSAISSSQVRDVTGHVSGLDSTTNIAVSFSISNICSTNVNCANVALAVRLGPRNRLTAAFRHERIHVVTCQVR